MKKKFIGMMLLILTIVSITNTVVFAEDVEDPKVITAIVVPMEDVEDPK